MARLDFSGAKGVAYLSSHYRVHHDPQIIDELRLVNKEQQVTKDETPEDKKKVSECQQLVAYGGARETGLAESRNWPSRVSSEQSRIGCSQEMWSDTTQIKDLQLSCMIDKVQNTTTAPNPQSSHIVSIATSINDILASSVQRPSEEGILLVDNEVKSDCIGQHIMPYREANNNNMSKLKLSQCFPWISHLHGLLYLFYIQFILGPK